MTGIVVDINGKDAVVLSDEGLFTKIKNDRYEIGQRITVQKSRQPRYKWITGAAGMAAALALCTTGAFAYNIPDDYVSLDVNPSIEYTVNMFERIIDVNAVNDDGEQILSNLDLDNMNIEDGVKETLDELIADGYLAEDPDSGVVITTSNEDMDEAEELAKSLEEEIQSYLDGQDGIKAVVDAEAVGQDRVEEARELGVTPGKLNLVEKLQTITGSAINKEEWLKMPVKDINKAIKDNRKQNKEREKETLKQVNSTTESGIRQEKSSSQKKIKTTTSEPATVKEDSDDTKQKTDDDKEPPEKEPAGNEKINQDSDKTEDTEDNDHADYHKQEEHNENHHSDDHHDKDNTKRDSKPSKES